jgi:hypothetical protein
MRIAVIILLFPFLSTVQDIREYMDMQLHPYICLALCSS